MTADHDQSVGAMCALISEVLDVADVAADDDFYELGGTSLKGAMLLAQIERRFGVRLAVTDLYEAGTAQALADRLADQRSPRAEVPVFLVHWHLDDLLREIRRNRPVVVLSYALDPGDAWPAPVGIEALAAHYVAQLRRIRPVGPYHLVGFSLGGIIAWEMARQLGETEMGVLCVIDALPPEMRRRRMSKRYTLRRLVGAPPRVLVKKVRRRVVDALLPSRHESSDRSGHAGRLAAVDHRLAEYRMRPVRARLLLIAGVPTTDYNILYEAPPPLGQAYADLGLIAGSHRLVEIPGAHSVIVHGALARQIAEAIESEIAATEAAE